jgi:UDP-4-amino-4,6-dideoxy-N-acetyl-beta-L-altrosamine transaminase
VIPYGHQEISQDDIDAVIAVLRSDHLTQGPEVPRFEAAVARYCGAQFGVAANSATSALHVACRALGVGPGDSVWTSPISFVASANCARYCGATVDFVDIDPGTCNMAPAALEAKLTLAKRAERLPKVVIPVHLCGQPCEMATIHELATRFGVRVIEDASHAIGGRYRNEPVGNCRYSDITVFSFHPVKVMTTGEGGMALTNDPQLSASMRLVRSHGITRDAAEMTREPDGPWYYEQVDLGFNYRMTDLQAALGSSQLRRLDEFVARRHSIAARYDEALASLPVATVSQHPDSYSARHLYVVRLQTGKLRRTHREVFERLRANGIGVNLHYIPIYRQPYYQRLASPAASFPEAERYYAEAVTLPMFTQLDAQSQARVVAALESACA